VLRSLAAPRRLCSLILAAGLLALAAPAAAAGGSKEAQAKKALKQALEEDYLNTRFDDAEQKLRAALQGCKKACSKELRAQLHVALGSVLAGGKKELEDARDEFVEALGLDPKAEPSKDLLSTEVSFAYEQARKKLGLAGGKPPPPPPPKPPPAETDEKEEPADRPDKPPPEPEKKKAPPVKVEGDEAEERAKEPPPAAEPVKANWITISFAPDLAYVSGQDVCTQQSQQGSHYACLRADGSRYVGTPTVGNGDQINSGMALGTMRVMLGYDRLVHPNITVGLRAGFAFNGAPSPASFLPVHGEARLGIWPGHDPFVGRGVRPMILISGGLAQVDVKVNVPVVEDGTACGAMPPTSTQSPCTTPSSDGVVEQRQQTLTVYRQNGLGFAAATLGVQFAPSTRVALHLALRSSVTFPSVTAVLSPEAGLSVGF
jgi:hypothetical protein